MDAQDEHRRHEDGQRLQESEESEAQHVAQHDFGAIDGRRHQAFQGAAGPLAQEADRGEEEDEEEGEEGDDSRRLVVHEVELGPAVDIAHLHRQQVFGRQLRQVQRNAQARHRCLEQAALDGADDGGAVLGVGAFHDQLDIQLGRRCPRRGGVAHVDDALHIAVVQSFLRLLLRHPLGLHRSRLREGRQQLGGGREAGRGVDRFLHYGYR